MRAWVRRNSLAALPIAVGVGLLLWIASIGEARPEASARSQESTAGHTTAQLLPVHHATGGPYVRSALVWGNAFDHAVRVGVSDPRVEKILATTYGEVLKWTRSGRSMDMGLDREVYLVTVQGSVIVGGGRHPFSSFSRTYYIYDAPTGQLIEWGATVLPEPEGSQPEFRR